MECQQCYTSLQKDKLDPGWNGDQPGRIQTLHPLSAHSARPATCTELLIPQTQCNGSVGLCVSLWRHEATEGSCGLVYKPAVTLHSAATKGWQRWYKTASLLSETLTNTASSWDFKKMNKPINILCSYSITAVWWDPLKARARAFGWREPQDWQGYTAPHRLSHKLFGIWMLLGWISTLHKLTLHKLT